MECTNISLIIKKKQITEEVNIFNKKVDGNGNGHKMTIFF